MRPLQFSPTTFLIWILSLVLLSVSACARPIAATGPDPITGGEITATHQPTAMPTHAPSTTPTPTPTPILTPSPSPTPARLSLTRLQNLSYPLYSQEGWVVPLKDGVYDSDSDEDFPMHVEIEGSPLFGDVNGDGLEDAVVLLYTQAAASGQFNDLAFVLNQAGEPHIVASIPLGDKVSVEAMTVNPDGTTTVTILSRNPEGDIQEEVRQYGPFKDTAVNETKPLSADFSLRYHWSESALPPPYHYEYTIHLGPGSQGLIEFWPDYPNPGTPVWTETFELKDENLEELYVLLQAKELLGERTRQDQDPPPGAPANDLYVTIEGRQIALSSYNTDQNEAEVITQVYEVVKAQVPEPLWAKLKAQYEQYKLEFEG